MGQFNVNEMQKSSKEQGSEVVKNRVVGIDIGVRRFRNERETRHEGREKDHT